MKVPPSSFINNLNNPDSSTFSTVSSLPSILKALGIPLSRVSHIEQRKPTSINLSMSELAPMISPDVEKLLENLGVTGGFFYAFSEDASFNRVRSRLKQMGILLLGEKKLKKLSELLGIHGPILGIHLQEGGLLLLRKAISQIANEQM